MLLIIGFLFMVLFFVFGSGVLVGMYSGPLFTLLHPWSFIAILVPIIFFLAASKSGKTIGNYFVSSFRKNFTYTITEFEGLSTSIKNTIKFTLATGGFNFIFFLINALSNLGSLNYLGPFLAMSLTSLTYSIAISYFVFFPVQAWAENKINALKNECT